MYSPESALTVSINWDFICKIAEESKKKNRIMSNSSKLLFFREFNYSYMFRQQKKNTDRYSEVTECI